VDYMVGKVVEDGGLLIMLGRVLDVEWDDLHVQAGRFC